MRPPSAPDRPAVGARRARPPAPPPSRWTRFVERYGWRAYALPVLVLLTVVALVTTKSSTAIRNAVTRPAGTSTGAVGGPATASANQKVKSDNPSAGSITTVLPSLQLPAGPAYTTTGTGTFTVVPGRSAVLGHGPLHRFTVEIENGVTGVDPHQFAATVMTALSNPQSWIATGSVSLERVDSGPVDFHVSLVSAMRVRQICGYDLPVETSCFSADDGNRVVLNVARWVRGAKAYAGDLATYRLYAVNHEVGHALGHNHSHDCLPNGLAPVMMQQTIGTKTASGQICQPNPWPYPKGTGGAPGAEQPGGGPDLEFFNRNAN
jgi:hypothetical protein